MVITVMLSGVFVGAVVIATSNDISRVGRNNVSTAVRPGIVVGVHTGVAWEGGHYVGVPGMRGAVARIAWT